MSTIRIIRECRDCGAPLVSYVRWLKLSSEERARLRREGVRWHVARGLCRRCWYARRVDDTLIDVERIMMSSEDLLDEWGHFPKGRETHTADVRAFADYLGRPFKSVERALQRAGVTAWTSRGRQA